MTYKAEIEYLEHDGGTKFYETVVITEDAGPGILIKRYGSIDKKMGGGQTIIERGSPNVVRASARKILDDKRKRRSTGQYVNAKMLDFGLHPVNNVFNLGPDELAKRVTQHFNFADADAIKSYFGIGSASAVHQEEPAAAEPEEPIIRDAHWGSW